MAPSEIPSSIQPPPHKDSFNRKKGFNDKGQTAFAESYINDGPSSSEEQYWTHRTLPPSYNNEDDPHTRGENSDDNLAQKSDQQSHHRPTRNKKPNHNNGRNGIGIKIPELRDAKTGVLLSQANVVLDRGGGVNYGDAGGFQSGEFSRVSPSTSNMPTGQNQHYPGYIPVNVNNNEFSNGQSNYNNHLNGGGGQPQIPNTNGMGNIPYFVPYPQNGNPYQRNYFDPHGQYVTSNTTGDGVPMVRAEEVGIVLVVLLLWVGAIILFFNRWGKIRMLEPYQPKFCENHRPSCPMAEVTAISNIPVCRERTFSKFNLSTEMLAGPNGSPHFVKCNYHGVPSTDPAPGFSGLTTSLGPGGLTIPGAGFPSGGSTGMLSGHRNSMMMNSHLHHSRPRQNSVFVTSPSSQVNFYGSDTTLKNSSRKTKSAVDLPTLVLTGEFIDNVRRNSKNSITQL